MRVAWQSSPAEKLQPYYRYVETNRDFIHLANLMHVHGLSWEVESVVENRMRQTQEEDNCTMADVAQSLRNYTVVSPESPESPELAEPVYKEEITEETLEAAAHVYFGLKFCPDYDTEVVTFYQDLLDNFSTEAVLRTLARLLYVASERRLTEQYNTARTVLDSLAGRLHLQYSQLAGLTTPASRLASSLYNQLTDLPVELRGSFCEDNVRQENLLRHIFRFSGRGENDQPPGACRRQQSTGRFHSFLFLRRRSGGERDQ